LGIQQVKSFSKTDDTIICSIDKDLLQIPGRHFNFVKGTSQEVSELEGLRHFYKQLLIGDTSDNVFCVRGIGPVKAGKLLDHINDPSLMYEIVSSQYDSIDRMHMNAKVLWIRQKENQIWEPPIERTMVQDESRE
jgi:5'-3' exonuclease